MRALSILLILIFMQMGCTGLVVYELVSSSQFIEDDMHEDTPMLNVKYYYDQTKKKDKSHMYPKPKSEFKPKKGE